MSAVFDPDSLRNSLSPLGDSQPLESQALAYRRFYRLPFAADVRNWLGHFEAGKFDVVGQVWMPSDPRATLVLVHGFYDHMGLYRHLIEWALASRFVVISCDLPGHGLTDGPRASIESFADYQVVLDALLLEAQGLELPKPWHLCGQSMGGAIVIDHLLHAGETSPAQGRPILLAPLVRPVSWARARLGYHLLRPFTQSIPRRFSENTHDPAFMPFLQADPLQPLRLPTAWVGALAAWIKRIEAAPGSQYSPLIVQGHQDGTVDWRHNLEVLQQKFAAPEILQLPEARHHLANEREDIRLTYLRFLDDFLGVS